jgi:hypothetical protein
MRGLNGDSLRLSSLGWKGGGWKGGDSDGAPGHSRPVDNRRRKCRLGRIQVSFRHTEAPGFRTGACRHHHSADTQKNDMVTP